MARFTLGIMLCLVAVGSIYAQDSLMPEDCVERMLQKDPQLRISRINVRQQESSVLQSKAAFDVATSATMQSSIDYSPVFSPLGIVFPRVTNEQYSLGLRKEFDLGVSLNASAGVQSSTIISTNTTDRRPQNRGFFGLNIGLPLLRNRGSAVTSAPLERSLLILNATQADVQQSVNVRTADVLNAYVELWHADRLLTVLREIEKAADRTYQDVQEFVKADRRTVFDLLQAQQTLLQRITERISQEQRLTEAYAKLITVLGDSITGEMTSIPPTTAKWELQDTVIQVLSAKKLIYYSLERKPDIRALMRRREAARRVILGAQSDLQPQLDVGINLGTNGFNFDNSTSRFYTSYFENQTPLNVSATLTWAFPIQNSQSRGALLASEMEHERTTTQEDDLRRTTVINCHLAINGVKQAHARFMINKKSLELAKSLYANEDVLMRSGKSTLTELRIRQENLLSSQQSLLNSARDLIQAAVNVRFLASSFYSQDGKFLITSISELFNLSELTE